MRGFRKLQLIYSQEELSKLIDCNLGDPPSTLIIRETAMTIRLGKMDLESQFSRSLTIIGTGRLRYCMEEAWV